MAEEFDTLFQVVLVTIVNDHPIAVDLANTPPRLMFTDYKNPPLLVSQNDTLYNVVLRYPHRVCVPSYREYS